MSDEMDYTSPEKGSVRFSKKEMEILRAFLLERFPLLTNEECVEDPKFPQTIVKKIMEAT